jgi:hypothetical protein
MIQSMRHKADAMTPIITNWLRHKEVMMLYSEFLTGTDARESPSMFDTYEILNNVYMDKVFNEKDDVYRYYTDTVNKAVIDYAVMFFREKLRQENEIKEGSRQMLDRVTKDLNAATANMKNLEAQVKNLENVEIEAATWKTQYENMKTEFDRVTGALKVINSYKFIT